MSALGARPPDAPDGNQPSASVQMMRLARRNSLSRPA